MIAHLNAEKSRFENDRKMLQGQLESTHHRAVQLEQDLQRDRYKSTPNVNVIYSFFSKRHSFEEAYRRIEGESRKEKTEKERLLHDLDESARQCGALQQQKDVDAKILYRKINDFFFS